jgi:hypothetical protein
MASHCERYYGIWLTGTRFLRPYLMRFALRIVWVRLKADAFLLVYAVLDPLLGKDDGA